MTTQTMNFRLDSEDKELIQSYAKLHGRSAGEMIREAILSKIEDEFDLHDFKTAKAEFEKSPVTVSQDDLMKKYGLR
jgi:predicted DNA-binding protein